MYSSVARFLIWKFGEVGVDHKLKKNFPTELNARVPMAVRIQIANFNKILPIPM